MSNDLKTNWTFKMALKKQGFTLMKLQGSTGINRSILSLYATGRYILDDKQRKTIASILKLPEIEIFGDTF